MIGLTILIILANFLCSWKGFKDLSFYERYKFSVEKVLVNKEYSRLLTSSFLHVGWQHIIWNMISLYAFGSVEFFLGPLPFLLIYFASLVGGNLLSLFIHRNQGDYSAVGASGGVNGVIFASITLFPGMSVGFLLLPIAIPGWIYGLIYVLVSILGIRSRTDNIGHDAHLGGALIGVLAAIIFQPSALTENYITILLISVPCIVFIYLIATRPYLLMVQYRSSRKYYSIDHRYNAEKVNRQNEIDRILDKIGKKGMSSLTAQEKEILKQQSKAR